MKLVLIKLSNILLSFFLFSWLFVAAHEMFHQWTALALGIEGGTVVFGWQAAHWYWPPGFQPTALDEALVSLGGGAGVAIVYGLALLIRRATERYSPWDLDDIAALMFASVWQFIYALSEVVKLYNWGSFIGVMLGMGLVVLLYGRKLLHWLEEEHGSLLGGG